MNVNSLLRLVRVIVLFLMFGLKYTVDDVVDTLSRYPVINPFGTVGGSHFTIRTVC